MKFLREKNQSSKRELRCYQRTIKYTNAVIPLSYPISLVKISLLLRYKIILTVVVITII